MVHIGLHKRYRVHLCVSFSCFLGVMVGDLMVMYVESVVRHRSKVRVLVALLSQLKSLTSVSFCVFYSGVLPPPST